MKASVMRRCSAPLRSMGTIAALGLTLGLLAGPADAKTKTVTIPATYSFQHGSNPERPGNCEAVGHVQWRAVEPKGATAWTVFFTMNGTEFSKRAEPPFNDRYTSAVKRTYTVPSGYHWLEVIWGGGDGPSPSDCSDFDVKHRAALKGPARVEVTVEIDEAACAAARSKSASKLKAVNRLKSRVAKATGKDKARLRKALSAAKKSRARAVANVTATC